MKVAKLSKVTNVQGAKRLAYCNRIMNRERTVGSNGGVKVERDSSDAIETFFGTCRSRDCDWNVFIATYRNCAKRPIISCVILFQLRSGFSPHILSSATTDFSLLESAVTNSNH